MNSAQRAAPVDSWTVEAPVQTCLRLQWAAEHVALQHALRIACSSTTRRPSSRTTSSSSSSRPAQLASCIQWQASEYRRLLLLLVLARHVLCWLLR
jgi:hypothetical protein